MDNSGIGATARRGEPLLRQLFVAPLDANMPEEVFKLQVSPTQISVLTLCLVIPELSSVLMFSQCSLLQIICITSVLCRRVGNY